ncbi:MAG TPA: ArsR family transcriptional regulator [Anaerolineae bacterium]|nr:ArsR family transcriptional regulator [Anaerolineae bacterium]
MNSINKKNSSTRDTILHAIKTIHEANVNDLAEAAGVSPVTVRHHLNALQADSLIDATPIRRKVGRPYYVYSLSEKGEELFPQKYVRLSNRLLDELKSSFPEGTVSDLFHNLVQRIVTNHIRDFEHLPFEERLNYLINLLGEEGFLAEWEQTQDGYTIKEYSCPYMSIGEKHHEVCTFDTALMTSILNTEIEQHSCMLSGADCCEFTMKNSTPVSSNLIQIEVK